MKKNLLLRDFIDDHEPLHDIHKSLALIQDKLLNELSSKQSRIDSLEEKVNLLEITIFEKNSYIKDLNKTLEACKKTSEGNRQVINKILNEMERLQQDIEWYKRTYEQRSFFGYIKQKLFSRNS